MIQINNIEKTTKSRKSGKINVNEDNISKLTKSKESFLDFSKDIKFSGPSLYFYLQIIKKINENQYEKLFEDNSFIEYLYATLACWGMHRMDKNTRMAEFEAFKESITKNKDNFTELSKEKIIDADIEKIKDKLLKIFATLRIMSREKAPKFVAHSKIMHFLLPNLIPPMDKGHIIYFFYGKKRKTKKGKTDKYLPKIKDEETTFIKTLELFQKIANQLNLKETDLKNQWDTSIPKLIDNAIIGYNNFNDKKFGVKT